DYRTTLDLDCSRSAEPACGDLWRGRDAGGWRVIAVPGSAAREQYLSFVTPRTVASPGTGRCRTRQEPRAGSVPGEGYYRGGVRGVRRRSGGAIGGHENRCSGEYRTASGTRAD